MGALEDLATYLLGDQTQQTIRAENPYFRIQEAPDQVNRALQGVVLKDPTGVSNKEALAWGVGSGLLSGLLGAGGQDYQNTLTDRYVNAVTGQDTTSYLPAKLASDAQRMRGLFTIQRALGEREKAQQAAREQDKEIFKAYLENPAKTKRALHDLGLGIPKDDSKVSDLSAFSNKTVNQAAAETTSVASDDALATYEQVLGQTGDEDLAKTAFKEIIDAKKKERDEKTQFKEKNYDRAQEYLKTTYADLNQSKSTLTDLETALQKAGETGGFGPEDTLRAGKLKTARFFGDEDAKKRLAARTDLGAQAILYAGQIRKLFAGATTEKELAKYLEAAPGTNKTPEENKAILDRLKRGFLVAQQRADFIEEATSKGYPLTKAQRLFDKLETVVPLFKNGEINPDRLALDVTAVPLDALETGKANIRAQDEEEDAAFVPVSMGSAEPDTTDQGTPSAPEAEKEQSPGLIKQALKKAASAGAQFGNTALFGIPQYLVAAGGTAVNEAADLIGAGEGKSIGENFQQELATTKQAMGEAAQESPIISGGAQIAGSIFSPVNKIKAVRALFSAPRAVGLAGRALFTGGTAAVQNELVGDGEDTGNRAENAALLSVFLDTAAKGAGKLAGPAQSWFRRMIGIGAQEYRQAAKGVSKQAITESKAKFENALNIIEKEQGIHYKELVGSDENVIQGFIGKAVDSLKTRSDEIDDIIKEADKALGKKGVKVMGQDISATAKSAGISGGEAVKNAGEKIISKFNLAYPKGAKLSDLQREKKNLNLLFEPGATEASQKGVNAATSDFRRTIEKTVDQLVAAKKLPAEYAGRIKQLNAEERDLLTLVKAQANRLPGAMAQDVIKNAQQALYTTSGAALVGTNTLSTAAGAPNSLASLATALAAYSSRVGRPLSYSLSRGDMAKFLASPELRTALTKVEAQSMDKSELPDFADNAPLPDAEFTKSLFSGEPSVQKKKEERIMSPKDSTEDEITQSLIQAVVTQESKGKPGAISEAGAIGLMQIMPETAKEIAGELGVSKYDLKNPETNLRFGTHYLRKLVRQFNGDLELALTAYHSGPERVKRLLKETGGSSLDDIREKLGPVGQRYAREVLSRMA